jgi:hypothetical protein
MFSSIEKGFEAYVAVLTECKKEDEKARRRWVSCDEGNLRDARLSGMAAALGLSEEEDEALKKKHLY